MSEIDLENAKVIFNCLRKGVGEEVIRKLQTMLNLGFTNEYLFKAFDWQLSPKPGDAKEMLYLCMEYMRQEMPVAPWRGR